MGRLYARDAVVEFLVADATDGAFPRSLRAKLAKSGAFAHIRALRDVFPVRSDGAPMTCAVTGHAAGPAHVFVALRPCGHCVCEHALGVFGESSSSSKVCPQCGAPFAADAGDVVRIGDTTDEGRRANEASLRRHNRAQRAEKKKKRQKAAEADEEPAERKRRKKEEDS